MSGPPRQPGIEHEPQHSGAPFEPDPSEHRGRKEPGPTGRDEAEHSVHNEPAIFPAPPEAIDRSWDCPRCQASLEGTRPGAPCPGCGWVAFERPPPTDRPSWATWLKRQVGATPPSTSARIAVLCALAGGPWAVIGTFLSTRPVPLAAVVFGPVVEEAMKVAMIWLVVEVRPWLFRKPVHIALAALGAALGFAVIENVLYLTVYVPDPPAGLVLWRWTVCTALHTTCTAVAAVGILRMWSAIFRQLRPPETGRALPWLIAAMVLHGAYNGAVTVMELSGFEF